MTGTGIQDEEEYINLGRHGPAYTSVPMNDWDIDRASTPVSFRPIRILQVALVTAIFVTIIDHAALLWRWWSSDFLPNMDQLNLTIWDAVILTGWSLAGPGAACLALLIVVLALDRFNSAR